MSSSLFSVLSCFICWAYTSNDAGSVFPAGYLIDYDNDNDQDFIATTNDYLLGLNTEHLWLYENLNTNDTFDLVFQTDTFLISDMIDIGAYSKPIFFNYNNDNLLDIVAGVSSTFGKSNTFHYGLWLYKNIGTPSAPKFELVTKNFGNIDGIGLTHLAPAAADADNDGDEDLFLGDINGNITYLENLSGGVGDAAQLISGRAVEFEPDGRDRQSGVGFLQCGRGVTWWGVAGVFPVGDHDDRLWGGIGGQLFGGGGQGEADGGVAQGGDGVDLGGERRPLQGPEGDQDGDITTAGGLVLRGGSCCGAVGLQPDLCVIGQRTDQRVRRSFGGIDPRTRGVLSGHRPRPIKHQHRRHRMHHHW